MERRQKVKENEEQRCNDEDFFLKFSNKSN